MSIQNPEPSGVILTVYLIIPHANSSAFRVLLQRKAGRWSLPAFQPSVQDFSEVAHINAFIADALGLLVTTLRCLQINQINDQNEYRFYALDNLHPEWEPPEGWFWVSETELHDLIFRESGQREPIKHWFAWRHSDSSVRPPWMRPGWFLSASDWLYDLADRLAIENVKAVQQIQAWARATQLYLSAGRQSLYLKAVPEIFNYEPVITRLLSIRFPGYVADVQAVHVDNRWMLTRQVSGKPLTAYHDLDTWKQVIERFAEIQLDLVTDTQSLIALGIPDRNVDYLASQISKIANVLPDGLEPEEQAEFKRMLSSFKSLCFDLVEHNIPLSMTHGDLRPDKIMIDEDGSARFYDWSNASVSHPFFDLPHLLHDIETRFPDVPDAGEQLRETYLKVWTRYEPLGNLRKAYHVAEVLSSLHQALFISMHVLPRIEEDTRWELRQGLPALMRRSLVASRSFKH